MARKKINIGDRVAYTAKFVRNTGSCYETGKRRGTVVSLRPDHDWVGVRWDDEDLTGWDDEYRAEVTKNGAMVALANICRVGSASFGDVHSE